MAPSSNVSLNTNAAFALVVASADAAASATATFIGIVKCAELYIFPAIERRANARVRLWGGGNEQGKVRACASDGVGRGRDGMCGRRVNKM